MQSCGELSGKVALVTGASRGIGLEIARALAARGAELILADRSESVEERVAALRSTGSQARALACDVTRESDLQRMFAGLERLDILVNNAAVLVSRSAEKLSRMEWQAVVDTNLSACFFASQSAARLMRSQGGGRIINLSSIVGRVARRGLAAYIAAKSGVDGLTRALACDLAGTNITVNAIAPGFIETEMSRTGNPDFERWVEQTVPARRWGRPEDIAGVAAFLASDAASYVNGQVIYVDGGFTAVSA